MPIRYPSRLGLPFLITLRGRLDFSEVIRLLYQASDVPVVSISQAQRYPVALANWIGSVPHGLPIDLLQPQLKPGKYLAFLGRMCQDKRPDAAIRLARILGQPIRLAAKVDKGDQEYFDTVIRPLLTGPTWNLSARSARARRLRSSATRRRFCSRSTGRNIPLA